MTGINGDEGLREPVNEEIQDIEGSRDQPDVEPLERPGEEWIAELLKEQAEERAEAQSALGGDGSAESGDPDSGDADSDVESIDIGEAAVLAQSAAAPEHFGSRLRTTVLSRRGAMVGRGWQGRAGRRDVAFAGARTVVLVVAVALSLTAIAALIQRPQPKPSEYGTTTEPIASTVLLCPEPGAGNDLDVRVSAAVIPDLPGQDAQEGVAGLVTLPGKQSATARIAAPGGQAAIEAFGTALPPIRAFGEGSLAPGLVADQWGRATSGTGRGMASTSCASAGSDFWFVGGGAIAGRNTRIVLVNPDDTAAAVDVVVLGPSGVIDTPAGRGLVVRPKSRTVVRLDSLAPGINATAVHVIARAGRVGAAVDDEQASGLSVVGTDWIPAAAEPATKVYLPGVIDGRGPRVLTIAAPGDSDALVDIKVISDTGTFDPADRSQVQVPANGVLTIDMAPVLQQQAATLQLTSDVPIVAGMRQFFGGPKVQDETSFTAGSQPFGVTAAVSGLPIRPATDVRLYITAPDTDAAVDVVLLPYQGKKAAAEPTRPQRITVKAGTITAVPISAPGDAAWFTAVVTPSRGSGPVLVAHRVRETSTYGDLVTGYPWSPVRTEVQVPKAEQDPGISIR